MIASVRTCARPARRHARGMATLNELKNRIDSTKNIRKITSSMKMVSAAKMRGDEARLKAGKLFGRMMVPVFRPNEEMAEEDDLEDVEELAAPDSRKGKVLFVALTSDRGLCGGVNSAVTRRLRRDADVLQAQNREFEIVSIGDKGRPQLQRVFPESFSLVIDEAWKNPLNFATTSALTEFLCAKDYDEMRIVYNVYKSAIAYDTVSLSIPKFASYDDMKADDDMADGEEPPVSPLPHLTQYEQEPDDLETNVNLFEFTLATTLHGTLLDALASEQSARMAAMDNASNNAGDMIDRLTLQYNRLRQAKITSELIEIISGAEALEGGD